MNLKTLIVLAGLVGFTGLTVYLSQENYQEKETAIMKAVKEFIDHVHFNPISIDDEYSQMVFHDYINRMDPGKRVFTREDIEKLEKYKHAIDEEVNANTLSFFDISLDAFNRSLSESEKIFREVIGDDLNFEEQDVIEVDYDKRGFAEDRAKLRAYWKQFIKYDVLNRMDNLQERQENKKEMLDDPSSFYLIDESEELDEEKMEKDREFVALSMDSLINRAHQKSKENFEKWFERMHDMRRVDWLTQYVNSVTNVFDPHTGYFKPKDKEDFDMRMSNRLEGIGAQLSKDGEYVKVAGIVPGGPAWEGKELQEDDLILKVAQEGEEPVDIMGMHLDDVVSLIRGEKETVVTLTVKHIDGEIENIEIVRDVIVFEENYVKSATLNDSMSGRQFGYIRLPSFYADFDDNTARSSSGDMKAELEKITDQGLEGVIVDLRNNGGGSLRDVIDVAGLFFEEGPVVQVKSRKDDPFIYRDKDKSVSYDGAVVVLVNHFSASASEILAAALQDYERAVIVGASTTFGKGTVQRFYDLDKALRGNNDLKPLGSLKITTQKYYRINGGSVQLKGVTPDIILPDRYNYVDVGEKDYDHALEWTKIEPVDYDQDVYTISSLDKLRAKSHSRVDDNSTFQLIEESALLLKELKEESQVPLTIDGYTKYKSKRDQLNEKINALDRQVDGISAELLEGDIEYVQSDSSRIERYNDFIDGLDEDIYIGEALAILRDMSRVN